MSDLVTITEDGETLPEEVIPVNEEAEKPIDRNAGLPKGATFNDDGSITLKLSWPASIKFRTAGGDVREEPIGDLLFHRLRGADLRAAMDSTGNGTHLLFARSIRKGDGRSPLIFDALDAIDARAALAIVSFLSVAGGRPGR